MDKVRVGDVVRLKSGGHSMTVAEVNKTKPTATCQWHGTEGKPWSWGYEFAALEKVEKSE
jgi:uncharacterized protein YodC (DUF2158 family)